MQVVRQLGWGMNPYPVCDPDAAATVIGVLCVTVIGLVMLLVLMISGEKRK